jgi:hypothetical protein
MLQMPCKEAIKLIIIGSAVSKSVDDATISGESFLSSVFNYSGVFIVC